MRALYDMTRSISTNIVVFDNCSDDGSADIARSFGAAVVQQPCTQPEALNRLVALADGRYTLLMHADVILLNERWFALCRDKIKGKVALVSPEDIGCGPLTRPFGSGMPESSFLFWATDALKRLRSIRWTRRYGLPLPHRAVDFFGPHVTHKLPSRLAAGGLDWVPMAVHWSDTIAEPIFVPAGRPHVWSEELPFLRYGLGNFYSLDGIVTHYHNWYDRIALNSGGGVTRNSFRRRAGFPPGYTRASRSAFLRDLEDGTDKGSAAGCHWPRAGRALKLVEVRGRNDE